ncbi:MAG: crotonase/enoyl-CoA hydratase family protein [Actinomycetota bacterium]|nr:crotonase/enoyl-CoA hydratase family protein [Actinomycetota bacterium]
MPNVRIEKRRPVLVVEIDRPEVRNAVDGPTASELADAFRTFEQDGSMAVAVLHGRGKSFCAGADLKAMSQEPERANRVDPEGDGPMGPTRTTPVKPVVAAIEGHAVAGGLELALWCDLRVAAEDATLGFFDRRWGVPLIDGGTIRLPRLIGQSRALDLILTGRPISAAEAYAMGLVNRVVPSGEALRGAIALAEEIARFPQTCVLTDRRSVFEQWDLDFRSALQNEFSLGMEAVASGETLGGAQRFSEGRGRHGDFSEL